ncbi:MAG: holo-ACP synthase [Candidatus Babeliales bacterium]
MIVGIGTDLVACSRFVSVAIDPNDSLRTIFHEQEIAYCCQEPALSAQRFATRFAAKEAAYKALSSHAPEWHKPFRSVAKHIWVTHASTGAPQLAIDWHALAYPQQTSALICFVSLSHTPEYGTAIVVLQQATQ